MTGRERLNAVLRKSPKDRLPWTTLVDEATLSHFPPELQGNGGVDFYRHIGCDMLMLNGWNVPHALRSPELRWPKSVQTHDGQEGELYWREWRTPRATLRAVYRRGHPVEYPVKSIDDVRIYREMWEGAQFLAHDDTAALQGINNLIGEDGVVTRFWGPSTIPRLLEEDMGTEMFYYLCFDHPAEMDALIRCMHAKELDAFGHLATGPWDSVTLCENTSTYYVSPQCYARYNMPHQRDFVNAVHASGKVALLHMCGHVHALLDAIKETGCDGIHALTPPPTGDTPWEQALDVLGEDLIIVGILDPSIFILGREEEIGPALERCITPRLREANFVLWLGADGLPVPLSRFQAVQRWMERRAAA